MLLKKEIDKTLECKSDRWKDQIVFSPEDISIMLSMPISSVRELCRNGTLTTFKLGRSYRITRASLYNYIQQCIEDSIIL